MIWQNSWAWIGLILLALPLLIHLLSRRHSRVQPFPTLRFLDATALFVSRRRQLSDRLLLLVRMAIITAAVAALAQPLLRTDARERAVGRTLARAVVLDTSASTRAVRAEADARANQLAAAAQSSVLIRTHDPAASLAGAVGWLEQQSGRRVVALVSDFQVGTIRSEDIQRVPAHIGIALEVLPLASASLEFAARIGPMNEVTTSFVLQSERTDAQWTLRATAEPAPLTLLAADADQELVQATYRAALSSGNAGAAAHVHELAVVFPSYPARAALLRDAREPNAAWMGAVASRLSADSSIERIAAGNVAGRAQLLIFTSAQPGTLASVLLLADLVQAAAEPMSRQEYEPTAISRDSLAQWQRAPGNAALPRNRDSSDGRWFWLLALLLIAVESWLRRKPAHSKQATSTEPQTQVARVA